MDDQPFIESLQQLSKASSHRPKSAIFRDLFPHIEAALQSGLTRQTVLNELNRTISLSLTFETFKVYLARARKSNVGQTNLLSTEKTKPLQIPADTGSSGFPQSVPASSKPLTTNSSSKTNKTSAPTVTSPKSPEVKSQPYDSSDPRAIDHVLRTPLDMSALAAAGKAQRKATKK